MPGGPRCTLQWQAPTGETLRSPIVRTVRLVAIPATGRHRYTVTMVETDDNFAGSATFSR